MIPAMITKESLNRIVADLTTKESAIAKARQELETAKNAAAPYVGDDGSLTPEQLFTKRAETNREVEIATITLDRAERDLEAFTCSSRDLLLQQCRDVIFAINDGKAAVELDIKRKVIAAVAPDEASLFTVESLLPQLLQASPALRQRTEVAGQLTNISSTFHLRPSPLSVIVGWLEAAIPFIQTPSSVKA